MRGLEAVWRCDNVYTEAYFSPLGLASDGVVDRELVEEKADKILFGASSSDVTILVVGDPFLVQN